MVIRTQSIRIVPLGGFGRIGMNCLVIETARAAIIVDCGVRFPSEPRYGAELVRPDFRYIATLKNKQTALVLTHGHEDHIAAVPHLLRAHPQEIICTAYTRSLVERRLRELSVPPPAFHLVGDGQNRTVADIELSFFAMPHSIPGNLGLAIFAAGCGIVHTGDFKLDWSDLTVRPQVLERLNRFFGADLLICDSTGAMNEVPAGSERLLEKELTEIIDAAKGRVLVAIFSSNTQRLSALFRIAGKTGRQVALCGRSVIDHFETAARVNHLSDHGVQRSTAQLTQLPSARQMVVVSGTQGEPRSALGRIASGTHSKITIEPGDTVIISARKIPGNELAINSVVDQLLMAGAHVLHTGNDQRIHVSGHGTAPEIRAVIEQVSPKWILPAHGTIAHMKALQQISGLSSVACEGWMKNGQVATLNKQEFRITGERVASGEVRFSGPATFSDEVIKTRAKMANNGLVLVVRLPGHHLLITTEGIYDQVVAEEKAAWLTARGEAALNATEHLDDNSLRLKIRRLVKGDVGYKPIVRVVSPTDDPFRTDD